MIVCCTKHMLAEKWVDHIEMKLKSYDSDFGIALFFGICGILKVDTASELLFQVKPLRSRGRE